MSQPSLETSANTSIQPYEGGFRAIDITLSRIGSVLKKKSHFPKLRTFIVYYARDFNSLGKDAEASRSLDLKQKLAERAVRYQGLLAALKEKFGKKLGDATRDAINSIDTIPTTADTFSSPFPAYYIIKKQGRIGVYGP